MIADLFCIPFLSSSLSIPLFLSFCVTGLRFTHPGSAHISRVRFSLYMAPLPKISAILALQTDDYSTVPCIFPPERHLPSTALQGEIDLRDHLAILSGEVRIFISALSLTFPFPLSPFVCFFLDKRRVLLSRHPGLPARLQDASAFSLHRASVFFRRPPLGYKANCCVSPDGRLTFFRLGRCTRSPLATPSEVP